MINAATAMIADDRPETDDGYRNPRSLPQYKRMWDEYRNTTEPNRVETLIDYDYYDGKQLTPSERATLQERGQPDIVINRYKVAINGILGITAKTHVDPRCWPRTPHDEDPTDVATDTLRYIVSENRFKFEKTRRMKDYLVGGTAAVLIEVNEDKEVKITAIRWEEYFHDPRARREDLKDARYHGIAKWMYPDEVPGLEKAGSDDGFASPSGSPGMVDESFEDRPTNQGWLDNRTRRVLVIELYHKYAAQWHRCLFYYGGVIEAGLSPYKDEKGRASCPIEAVSCYVDRDNNRYGVGRDMRDLQDEINKRRSKLLHLVTSSQIQARDPSAVETNADDARLEAARPDGVLPYGWERVNTTDMSQGQMHLLAESKSEMERFGPNPAVLGRQGADTSGRALLARQQAGMVELAIIFEQFEDWELRVYKQCWSRAKQYWTAPMWVRVTDDEDAPRFVMINAPRGPQLMGPDGQPQMGEDGQAQYGEPQTHPETFPMEAAEGVPHPYGGQEHPRAGQSVFGYSNQLSSMDIDIIVDVNPETANIMAEQLKDLIQVISANPAYAAQVPFEVLIEMTPLPRKRQLMAKIKKFREEQQQAQGQQQQMQMQAAMAKLQAEIKKILSEAGLNEAKVQQALAAAELAMAQAEEAEASAGLTSAEAHATPVREALGAAKIVHEMSQPQEPQGGAV